MTHIDWYIVLVLCALTKGVGPGSGVSTQASLAIYGRGRGIKLLNSQ